MVSPDIILKVSALEHLGRTGVRVRGAAWEREGAQQHGVVRARSSMGSCGRAASMLPSTGGVEPGTEGVSVEQVLRVWRCGGVEVRPTWSSCAAVVFVEG